MKLIAENPPLSHRDLLATCVWRKQTSVEISDLFWSPDGQFAAYVLTERRENPEDFYHFSLCYIRASGRDARRLYSMGMAEEAKMHTSQIQPEIAAWSPDSRRVLFWKRYSLTGSANADGSPLFDIPITGGKPRLLTIPFRRRDGYSEDGMMRREGTIAFSPDGRYLLLVVGYSRAFVENKRIACVEYPSGRRKWLTEVGWAASNPVWSPDGRQIAFTLTPDPHMIDGSDDRDNVTGRLTRMHLAVMNADGTSKRALTNDPRYRESEPRWLPGRTPVLQFVRCENVDITGDVAWESRRSLWEIGAEGRGLRKIRPLPPAPLE